MRNWKLGVIILQSIMIAALVGIIGFFIGQKPASTMASSPPANLSPTTNAQQTPLKTSDSNQAELTLMRNELMRERAEVLDSARLNSTASILQTLRGQMELYKIQHADTPPSVVWTQMLCPTNTAGATINGKPNPTHPFGPYVQFPVVNPMNGQSAVGDKPSPNVGWVYQVRGTQYTVQAVNSSGDGVLSY